jgi:hypothetical protein
MPSGQRTTTESFIKQAQAVHGDKYDYSKVKYIKTILPVIIICIKCSREFPQKPCIHLNGSGCDLCGNKRKGDASRDTLEKFIEKAKAIHGDKFDYSAVKYENGHTEIEIKCNNCLEVHNLTPRAHLTGVGCSPCTMKERSAARRFTQEQILLRCREIHGDKYDYSKMNYTGIMDNVDIKCNDCGNEFPITMNSHLNHAAGGCKTCARKEKITTLAFIKRATEIHGDHYDYKMIPDPLPNNDTLVDIFCNVCEKSFPQRIRSHLSGNGCTTCACREPITRNEFIRRSIEGHPSDQYDYSEIPEYPRVIDEVYLTHKKCGTRFPQLVSVHLSGSGCTTCRKSRSEKACRRIFEKLMNLEFPARGKLPILSGLDLDGYCEDIKLAFEYQGIQHYKVAPWFGMDEKRLEAQQKRDQKKRDLCKKHGITLIEVPYEYSYKNEKKMEAFILEQLMANNYIFFVKPKNIIQGIK